MGRPRIDRVLPIYASCYSDRHGKLRIRLRRTGWRTVYVQARPGSVEFTQAYTTWELSDRISLGGDRIVPGTFDDLISRFYRSDIWEGLRDSTREQYRGQLERFREKYGSRPVAGVEARHLQHILNDLRDTPVAANNLRKRLKQLLAFAIVEGFRKDNPAMVTRRQKEPGGGFPDWTEDEIHCFEQRHPVGTTARLAFDLALYTAQRKSDVNSMGKESLLRGKIRVKQLKTDKELMIPIHANLLRSLAAVPSTGDTFVTNTRGRAYTVDSFGMWFKRKCREAGINNRSMHGLRKAASRRMAECGLSNQLIKSITGHSNDAEVAHYTRGADQERMAEKAMKVLNLANHSA